MYSNVIFFFNTLEKNELPSQSCTDAFSTSILPTSSFITGEPPALPLDFSKNQELLNPNPESDNQSASYNCDSSHSLLSTDHTLYEEEEEEQSRSDDLVEQPIKLIAAGNC